MKISVGNHNSVKSQKYRPFKYSEIYLALTIHDCCESKLVEKVKYCEI